MWKTSRSIWVNQKYAWVSVLWEKGELGGNSWCLVSTYLKKKLLEAEITFHQNTTVRTTPPSLEQMHTSGSKSRAQTLLQTNRWCCRIILRTWGIVERALQNVHGEVNVFPNFYSPPLIISSNFTRWTWFFWEPLAFKAFRGSSGWKVLQKFVRFKTSNFLFRAFF